MTASETLSIVAMDLDNKRHAADVLALTEAYARDPLGKGGPLPPEARARLIDGLRAMPTAVILVAYVEGRPAGIATCFRGFSTFRAQPIINIHDLAVHPDFRGRGVGRALLRAVADRARADGCCKVTLEVQSENRPARTLYESEGFSHALVDTPAGGALFFAKRLDAREDLP